MTHKVHHKHKKSPGMFDNIRWLDILFAFLFVLMIAILVRNNVSLNLGDDRLPSEQAQDAGEKNHVFPYHEETALKSDAIACYDEEIFRGLAALKENQVAYDKAVMLRKIERQCLFLKAGQTVYVEEVGVWENIVKIKMKGEDRYLWVAKRVID